MRPATTTAFRKWWNSKSKTFSVLCDEDFTHGEVVKMHVYFAALVIACCLASRIGGAL